MSVTHIRQVAIETRHLYKRFGDVTALDDINLRIAQGEFVAIMGASGSGKTTLMNILTCLDTATEGQVFLDGTDAAALDEEGRRRFRAEKIGLVQYAVEDAAGLDAMMVRLTDLSLAAAPGAVNAAVCPTVSPAIALVDSAAKSTVSIAAIWLVEKPTIWVAVNVAACAVVKAWTCATPNFPSCEALIAATCPVVIAPT